jgi:predicted Zn finger-like uncharacterized protein
MVIVCQKCQTRFQLDDARIPARGARVRCSRCKHAFVVVPPGAHDETVHRLAAEAAATGRPSVPEPSADLRGAGRRAGRGGSGDEPEDDWQFNIEPPGERAPAPAAAPPPPPAARPSQAPPVAAAAEPEAPPSSDDIDSLFELGGLRDSDPAVLEGEITDSDPTPFEDDRESFDRPAPPAAAAAPAAEGWDVPLDGRPDPRPRSPRAAAPPRGPTAPTAAAPRAAREPAEAQPIPARARRERDAEPALAGRLLGAAGWAGALTLFALGLLGALAAAPVEGELPPQRVGAFELRGLRARHLDNYFAGPVLVVQGQIENSGRSAASLGGAPQVRLAGTSGVPSPVAWLGAALHESALRERDPRELTAALEHSARQLSARPLRPGESLPVQAVFEAPPAAASGLRIELAAVTLPAPAPPPATEPPGGQPSATPGSAQVPAPAPGVPPPAPEVPPAAAPETAPAAAP